MLCSAGLLHPINSRLRRLNEFHSFSARIALPTMAKLRQPRALVEVTRSTRLSTRKNKIFDLHDRLPAPSHTPTPSALDSAAGQRESYIQRVRRDTNAFVAISWSCGPSGGNSEVPRYHPVQSPCPDARPPHRVTLMFAWQAIRREKAPEC